MARKKKKGGRRSGLSKTIDRVFEILGVFVAAGPAIQGVMDHVKTDPQNIPAGIAYRYTGMDVNSGQWNQAQAIAGLGTVAVGGVVAAVPRIFRIVKNLIKGRR